VGALEGALVGFLLASSKNSGALILAVTVDRCILLGLIGVAVGAALGVLDWYRGFRRKNRGS
jgi:hypothetical protein